MKIVCYYCLDEVPAGDDICDNGVICDTCGEYQCYDCCTEAGCCRKSLAMFIVTSDNEKLTLVGKDENHLIRVLTRYIINGEVEWLGLQLNSLNSIGTKCSVADIAAKCAKNIVMERFEEPDMECIWTARFEEIITPL